MTLEAGTQLGAYTIEKRIGAGGMGEVFLAHDTALNRRVAIKTLLPMLANDAELVRRFQVEAQAVAQLSHPNIVQIYQVDIESDPMYMVMEYIDGLPLDLFVKQRGKLTWQETLSIGNQVAAALACTHAKGIIHRDIKPANIILDRKMGVHVTDFGIAKVLESQTRLTATNTVLGSPSYMSPEHCGLGNIVPASDIFSLGVTLFEALTGELPFKSETALGLMNKIATQPAPSALSLVSELPPIVPVLLETMLGKDTEDRYASASQIIEDLRAYRDGKTPTHISMIRNKRSESDDTIFEVVVPCQNILEASKGKSMVGDLLVGQEDDVSVSIVIQPDSMLPTYLIRGGVGAIAIAGIAGFVAIVGNMKPPLPAEEPSQPIITPVQPAPESPVDQVQPSVFKPSTRQFDDPRPDGGREGLPIDPEGVQRKPYDAWKPGGPLPDGGRGPDARVGPRRGDRQPPSPPLR